MVKPDLRHNYYADLELPTTATLDEIHKAYRKLALQYHPDRNCGREDEVVPKFQAIQAANEVLGDPINKQKYDSDRRNLGGVYGSGLKPGSRTATPTGPYAANSPFPPPPRRTQPPYQQPPRGRPNQPPPNFPPNGPTPTSAGPPPGNAGTGADRFAGFPRPSDKKDPAQDRANVFKAWQNMQNTGTPDRQQRQSQPNPQPAPHPTSRTRPPPPPPPRQDGRDPAEDLRGKYKTAPPYNPDTADKRQSAWAAFQQSNAGKPGMPPADSGWKDPRKGGFNPRPTTGGDRPDDFGRPRPNVKVQPPQSSGRPDAAPETPISPKTQRARPGPGPFQQSNSRGPDDQVPFAEGNRVSTPYTHSYVGERTSSFGEGLRRSHSTRDTSKLAPESRTGKTRARSSSPQRTSREGTPQEGHRHNAGFKLPDSGDEFESDADITRTPDEMDDSVPHSHHHRTSSAPNSKPPFARPESKNKHFDGTASGPTSPPFGGSNVNGGGRPDNNHHGRPNMYADPSSSKSSSSSSSQSWASQMFGSSSTPRAERGSSRIPKWAIPSSLNPVLKCDKQRHSHTQRPSKEEFVTAADERFINATRQEQTAFLRFQQQIEKSYTYVPDNLDMGIFLKLALMSRKGEKSGDAKLDSIVVNVLSNFDTVGYDSSNNMADKQHCTNSFDYTPEPDQYAEGHTHNRNEANINTTFSPDGWKGEFVGEPDYFAPPSAMRKKKPSPSRRPPNNRATTSQSRSATMDEHPTTQYEDMPQRPYGSDGTPSGFQRTTPAGSGFDREGWEREIQDSGWAWPPPPAGPPSPGKNGSSSRKQSQSRKGGKTSKKAPGTKQDPHVVDDEDGVHQRSDGHALEDDVDAMDIDDTPPSHHPTTHTHGNDTESGARQYSVPPSDWQRQQEKHRSHRKSSIASKRSGRSRPRHGSAQLNTNLDDLRDSLAQSTATTGDSLNLNDMSNSLPFQSQPSGTMFGDPSLPRDLLVPQVPKPPQEPQKLSKASWHAYASAFGEYVKAFHTYNSTLLRHFESREQQAQAQIATGMGWLEATGDTSGRLTAPTGFGTYLRGVKEDERVREGWGLAWERHAEAVKGFERVKDRVRKLVVGGMLVEG